MSKIFYLMGKSASGKDTIYKAIQEQLHMATVIPYTTRPIRKEETQGVEYHFVTNHQFEEMKAQGIVIEARTYQTVHGPWTYYTADDGQIDVASDCGYLMIGTLDSYKKIKEYFGNAAVIPVYLELGDRERLLRAIDRESQQENPQYREVCRRFLADEQDFSKENLVECGITEVFINDNLEKCTKKICDRIQKVLK